MEANLKKGYWIEKKDNHLRSNTSSRTKKELWIVKKDNRLKSHVTLEMDKRELGARLRRKNPWLWDNYFYRTKGRIPYGESSGWEDDSVASNLAKECQKLHMGGHSSWSSDNEFVEGENDKTIIKDDAQESSVSMDIFPIELQEQILTLLPFRNILKARSVCKLWNEIVVSKRFQEYISGGLSKKPWYFMSANPHIPHYPVGFLYNPVVSKWYNFELPFKVKHDSEIASSHGLVCYIDTDCAGDLLVCNLMTNRYKKLVLPLGEKNFEYHGLAFSVEPNSSQYTISVVRSMGYDVLINVYSSETSMWNCQKKTLQDWKGRGDCVILNGMLYLLVLSTTALPGDQHGVLVYDLGPLPSNDKSEDTTIINIPFTITCGRLMNVQDKLVMVGGTGIPGRHGVITGIGIWVLKGTEWEEVVRVLPKMLHAFGELDDVFGSCGGGDTIYIHTYGGTNTLVFDMNSREWKWAWFPLNKKYPLQIFTGFCFYPRLDVSVG
ncbi:PREDICTED: F-box/kelch-repeat protein At3g61590-like [Ipomoea nil]|uniref:F-box/kelch-repeat protein At3g61590-like n=1 Tax=Ipomoea nil TaxID=35883 RepID=UPI000901EC79|nr:PREDICTED: F-box/kelch-repeat protein At3g61590-like [Ipomoea nil]